MKFLKNILLLIFPLLFLFITLQYKKEITNYSLTTVDPEMAYLYNSLAITQGHLPYFVDHPGIPLQYIGAAVVAVTHIFRDNKSLEQDVMLNPDYYIHNIGITFIILLTFSLLILGYITKQITNNTLAGMFIQLTPFIACLYLNIANRLIPELFSLIVVAVFFMLCLSYSTLEITNKTNRRYIFYFAIIAGIGISLKITFAPYILIPLIVIRGIKNKLLFGLELLLSTSFFSIPALNRWVYFRNWIENLFIHSGQYGNGDSNIIDSSIFKNNLIQIYQFNPLIVILLIILTVGLLIYFIPKIRVKRKKDMLFLSALSFTITAIVIILLIAKQLKFYYLSPALVLVIPAIILLILVYNRNRVLQRYLLPISFIVLSLFIYKSEAKEAIFGVKNEVGINRINAMEFVNKNLKNVPVAIVANYYGAPFLGYSAFYGMAYSSQNYKNELKPLLYKTFPNIYTYHNWNNRFNYWDDVGYTLPEIIQKHDSVFLYLGDEEIVRTIEMEVLGINRKIDCSQKIIYQNTETGEKIIKLKTNPEYQNKWIINCDAEQLDSTSNNFINKDILFQNGSTQSSNFARSGIFSSCLTNNKEFGIGAMLTNVQKGDHYLIFVWKYDNGNNKSVLVVAATDVQKYYNATSQIILKQNNWQKILIDIKINKDLNGNNLKIYCWLANDNVPAYFDDFCIEKIQ